MKSYIYIAALLVATIGTLSTIAPAFAGKSCNYTTADKKKGYRC